MNLAAGQIIGLTNLTAKFVMTCFVLIFVLFDEIDEVETDTLIEVSLNLI